MAAVILLRTTDALVARRVEVVAVAAGLDTASATTTPLPEPAALAGLVVELGGEGSLEVIAATRSAAPDCTIVAFLSQPDPELWRRAEAAGADVVTTRGRADRALAATLADRLSGRRRARRIRLAPLADFAGRLGYVGRVEDTPVGPIALYHLDGALWAIADSCPHAGASLCEGELDGDVVTCPRHGSQFRVTDGARVRGPADLDVPTFPVVVEVGEAFVEMPG
jgi:nitrite reductase/ring-hydroxylating ferredoxin subunit